MRSYTLDVDAAKKADEGGAGGNRITKTGKYIGTFTKAKAIKAKSSGAEGIEFTFKSDTGEEANYLNIYTHDSTGEVMFGFDHLSAIMACLGVRSITPTEMIISEYNFETNSEQPTKAILYFELMKKPIGLLLEKEIYTKANGKDGEKMAMVHFFESSSGRTAKERLDDLPPTAIEEFVVQLSDRDKRKSPGAFAPASAQATLPIEATVEFDDDIPF